MAFATEPVLQEKTTHSFMHKGITLSVDAVGVLKSGIVVTYLAARTIKGRSLEHVLASADNFAQYREGEVYLFSAGERYHVKEVTI